MTSQHEDDFILGSKNCTLIDRTTTRKSTIVYLSGDIGEPANYIELLHLLRYGQGIDAVVMHINSPGGYVSTGIQIMNPLQETTVPVATVVDSHIASMASILSVASRCVTVSKYCSMMFHDFSSIESGKGNEMHASINFHKDQFEQLLISSCKGFLAKKEISAILKGKDLYLNESEITNRLKKCNKLAQLTVN